MIMKDFKGIKLSALGMGNMRLPVVPGKGDGDIDFERASAIIDKAMAAGVNYYDTAYVYHSGKSESFLGDALVSRYPRDSFYIATKFNIGANPDYKAVFAEQLEKLKTDRVDFYLLHAVGDNTAKEYVNGGSVKYFEERQKEGKVKYLGFSAHCSTETLKEFAALCKWDFAQLQINYYDWKYGNAKEQYEVLRDMGIPVVVMEPVRGGRLAALSDEADGLLKNRCPDRSIASWAFRWLMGLDNVLVTLSGMSNVEQMEDNLATFDEYSPLDGEEEKLLFTACEMFRNKLVIPCTACRYCTDDCPSQINIPEFLRVYNRIKTDGDWAAWEFEHIGGGKAAECLSCGACTGHCPQGIDVPKFMGEIAGKFGK
ncbi:MAG: aldo/keto reductase [Ruminococcus sp.]|nr:aldo/keto reductase [Ruminococcus sp.]